MKDYTMEDLKKIELLGDLLGTIKHDMVEIVQRQNDDSITFDIINYFNHLNNQLKEL